MRPRTLLIAALLCAFSTTSAAAAPAFGWDRTAPKVQYVGNIDTYEIDGEIDIKCVVTEEGSGLLRSTCKDIKGSAVSFGLGHHRRTAMAIDRAANTGRGEAWFWVKVTPESLCRLARRDIPDRAAAGQVCDAIGAAAQASARKERVARSKKIEEAVKVVTAQRKRGLAARAADTLIRYARTIP